MRSDPHLRRVARRLRQSEISLSLPQNRCCHGIDRNAVGVACMFMEHPDELDEHAHFVVARGTPAKAGQDGYFVNDLDLSGETQVSKISDTTESTSKR